MLCLYYIRKGKEEERKGEMYRTQTTNRQTAWSLPAERRQAAYPQMLVALRRLTGERYAITSADLVKAINDGDTNALTGAVLPVARCKPEWSVTSQNVGPILAAYARDKPVRCGPLCLG